MAAERQLVNPLLLLRVRLLRHCMGIGEASLSQAYKGSFLWSAFVIMQPLE
jgi:hypothetical protein